MTMGCCGLSGSKYEERLAALEGNVSKQKLEATGPASLEANHKASLELRELMLILMTEGARDRQAMLRVELLSNAILANLERVITPELLQRADFPGVRHEILCIAENLDAVRATKASTVLEATIEREHARIRAAQEQRAGPLLAQFGQAIEQMPQPGKLTASAVQMLRLADEANKTAPESKLVADKLLQGLVALSTQLLKLQAVWLSDARASKQVQDLCRLLDETASRLVAVMDAHWDPPMLPHVQQLLGKHAEALWPAQIEVALREASQENVGAAFDALEALLPWWPHVKESGACSVQIIGAFSRVQSVASEGFIKATAAGDDSTCCAIREFAEKYDCLRSSFEGLPPSADGGLVSLLAEGESTGAALRQVTAIEAEVAKASGDDASTTLSLAALTQTLEALVSLPAATDAALLERLAAACQALEGWAERVAGAAGAGAAGRVDSVLRFADEYDSRRRQLPLPLPEAALRPRIATRAVASHLLEAEAELGKTAGLNPNALLAAIKAAAAALPPDDADLRKRLVAGFAATDRRVSEAFSDAAAAGEARKEQLLMLFAQEFDEAVAASCLEYDCRNGCPLSQRLQQQKGSATADHIASLEQELAKGSRPSLDVLSYELRALGASSALLAEQPEVAQRVWALVPALLEHLHALCAGPAAARVLELAEEADTLLGALPRDVAPAALRAQVWERAVNGLLTQIAELAGAGLDLDGLACLTQKLHALQTWVDSHCPPEVWQRLTELSAEGPVGSALAAALLAQVRLAAVMEAAAAADAVCSSAGTGEARRPDLCERLRVAEPVAAKLAEAREELLKASGLNPAIVLKVLQALEPLWAPVAHWAPFVASLAEVLSLFHERLIAACRKAVDADVKKVQALLSFARMADAAQQALLRLGPPGTSAPYVEGLAKVAAEDGVADIEAELCKDSGLNPVNVLRGTERLAAVWSVLAVAEAAVLKERWEEARAQVCRRMRESLQEAAAVGDAKKRDALLKFAGDFDAACTDALVADSGLGLLPTLSEDLEALPK